MKSKIKKPVFSFTPSMLDRQTKVVFLSVAYRELAVNLSAQLEISLDETLAVLNGCAKDNVDTTFFYDNLETDKRLMLDYIKTAKENFEKEYN